MVAKRASRALVVLLSLPSAAFALGLGDIRLLSPLNAPLNAEIEVVDATPEELANLQAQIASRDTFARYGLDWPLFLSTVQVRAQRAADGREIIKIRSSDSVTEPFITLLLEVNWSRGRLVREYTMLLDPPVYTPAQPGTSAPVAAPAAAEGAREGAIAREATAAKPASSPAAAPPVSEPAAAPSGASAAPAAAPAPQDNSPASAAAAPAAPPSAAAPAPTGDHLVKRGETLSGIASATSGAKANSAKARSWMVAIYQANPRAFQSNMNVLRSGSVLRIPEASAADAVSPSEAAAEIHRQYVAWRDAAHPGAAPQSAATGASGRLHLVTPTEPSAAGAGGAKGPATAGQGKTGSAAQGQADASRRPLQMNSEELGKLQGRLADKAPAPAAAPSPQAPGPQAAPSAPAAAAPAAPAAEAAPPPAPDVAAAPAPPKQGPVHTSKPAPTAQPESGGSLLDTLKDLWWVAALLIAAVAGLFGLKAYRARRRTEFDDSLGRLAVAGAAAAERSFTPAAAPAPARPAPVPQAAGEPSFLVEESGPHEKPRWTGAAAGAPTKNVTADDTISSETAINLDQGDPLAEADFHMAYGLYDQAADLVRIAISREPERRDLQLKLLEVFFVWGNKEQFLQTAHELAATREHAAPGEWEKIVIMGKQLAPEDPLFAGGGTSGATAGGVDLDLDAGQGAGVDFDVLGEGVPAEAHTPEGAGLDLDIGSALESTQESPASPTDRNPSLDGGAFEATTATTRQMAAQATQQMTQRLPEATTREQPQLHAGETMETELIPDFSLDADASTIEQPALTTQGPALRQKVEMAMKASGAEHTTELALDDLGLDLSAETADQPSLKGSGEAPTLIAGLDDRSRKVMEEAQQRAGREDGPSATGSWHIDENELEGKLRAAPEADPGATSRLAALHTEDVDFNVGEQTQVQARNGAALDLDVGTATLPDAHFTSTQKLAADDLALPDLEPVTMSEVGTKLDLARAYMDMGDPDGARNILEEVLHEGSAAQKQEAQRLMESLPG